MNAAERSDPESASRADAQEHRGRLKVFLGAAPGVGKTFEMLSEGELRRRADVDVVVGLAETHGRVETEALVAELELVPRREMPGDGRILTEMDLDAILVRRPELVLVDELAHSNVPGSRHPKRYQDVEELLDAGIDVYSTVNIQHIESLNDVVASFTHVRVDETVPDRILETAEIQVVDLPPDELIERLKEGKVHVPEEATRALAHYFSKSNLSALRELALRRAAQAVDAQMLDYVRSHALAGNWAGGERIVVAVSELPSSEGLVRAAKRVADAMRAPWTALHVETPREKQFGEEDRRRLVASLNLASQLGAAVVSMPAASALAGIKAYVAEARATQLIVGKSARSRWFELRHGSVVDRLVRETPGVAVHVLPMDGPVQPATGRPVPDYGTPGAYGWTMLMVAAVTAVGTTLFHILNLANVALLYLLPVMAAASLFGRWPALFAGIASLLAYNFFFLPPTGTLTVSNPENVVTILVLLGVAIVTSQLSARLRAQADLAGSSARQNAALAGFLRQLGDAASEDELLQAICAEIARLLEVRTVMLTPSPEGPQLRAAFPPEDRMELMERTAAQWVLEKGVPAGRGSDTLTASDWLFYPLKTEEQVFAAIGLAREDAQGTVRSDRIPLLISLLDQATLALERMRLGEAMRGVAELRERDRLRAALLASVSHDLRAPLAAILGTVKALRTSRKAALIETLDAESQRLSRFVANLLDMARVEAGALELGLQPVDLTDAVASAVHETRATLQGHAIELDVSPGLPLVRVDPQLFNHCLVNLLDNAGRYADPGTPVAVVAERAAGSLTLSVLDEGPGLKAGREQDVFETFRGLEGAEQAKSGTGLGLALVKGFAEAMGIGVEAANRGEPRGARFTLRFPEKLLVRAGEGSD